MRVVHQEMGWEEPQCEGMGCWEVRKMSGVCKAWVSNTQCAPEEHLSTRETPSSPGTELTLQRNSSALGGEGKK